MRKRHGSRADAAEGVRATDTPAQAPVHRCMQCSDAPTFRRPGLLRRHMLQFHPEAERAEGEKSATQPKEPPQETPNQQLPDPLPVQLTTRYIPFRSMLSWLPSLTTQSQLRQQPTPAANSTNNATPARRRRPSAPPPPLPEPPPPQHNCREILRNSPAPNEEQLPHSYELKRPVPATRRLTTEARKKQSQRLIEIAKSLLDALQMPKELEEDPPWQEVEAAIDAFTAQLYDALAPPPLPPRQPPRAHQGDKCNKNSQHGLSRLDKAILLADDAYKQVRERLTALKMQLPPGRQWSKEQKKRVDRLRKQLRKAKRKRDGIKIQAQAGQLQHLYRVHRKKCVQQILEDKATNIPKYCPLSKQQVEDYYRQQQEAEHGYTPEHPLAQRFWATLHPALEPTPPSPPTLSEEDPEEEEDPRFVQLTSPFTEASVLAALKKSNKAAAPGHDGLSYQVYLQYQKTLLAPLTLIMNICLRYKKTPASWKRSIVSLIPKPGKSNYDDISCWRPISLQPCIAKIYNSLLAKRLQTWAITRRQISWSQKGFMPVSGCHEHLFVAHSILNSSKRYVRSVHMAWYDIKDAFGSVSQQHIFNVLYRLGLPEDFLQLIQHEYSGASFQVRTTEGLTAPIGLKKGVKQGCPLSPLLFNFALEPLLRVLESAKDPYLLYGPPNRTRAEERCNRQEPIPVHCLAYADDLKIVSNSADGLKAHHKIVAEFLQVSGLRANPSKCAVLGVSKVGRRLEPVEYAVELHSEKIPRLTLDEAYRYLGLPDTLSSQQQRMHVAGVIRKAQKDAFVLFNSGLTPQQKLDAFRVFIMSRFDYHVRHSTPLIGDLTAFDTNCRGLVNTLLRLGRGASVAYVHLPTHMGGLGVPSLQQLAEATASVHAYQMLTSQDDKIRKIALGQMLEVIACKCRIGVYPSTLNEAGELIEAFVNGVPHANLAPLGRGSHDIKTVFGSLPHNFKMCDLQLEHIGDCNFSLVSLPSNKNLLKLVRKRQAEKMQEGFKKLTDQGKLAGYASRESATVFHPFSTLSQREVQFVARARINCLPVRERLRKFGWIRHGNCRKGCHVAETLPHVINHCPKHLSSGVKDRHNRVLDKICRELRSANPTCQLLIDQPMPGATEAHPVRPDIQLVDHTKKLTRVIDVAVAFDDSSNKAFEATREAKQAKYEPLKQKWKSLGYKTTVDALVYGSLGSVAAHNTELYTKDLCISQPVVKRLQRAIVEDVVRQSCRIWNKHVKR